MGFQAPADGSVLASLAKIRGTAVDALAGVTAASQIEVAIGELSPGLGCWDGSVSPGTFTLVGCPIYYPITGPRNGTFVGGVWDMDAPLLTTQHTYRVWVRARDNAVPVANVSSAGQISTTTFSFNTSLPAVALTAPPSLPAVGGNRSAAFGIVGTAAESFGVTAASVAYQEADSGMWHDNVSGTFSATTPVWRPTVLSGSAPNYTFTATPPALPASSGRNYNILPKAIGSTGLEGVGAANTVKWDTSLPASGVSVPALAAFGNALPSISGTASDPGGAASGVSGTQVQIRRDSDNICWNGAAWSANCSTEASWLSPSAGLAWSKNTQLPPPNNLPSGLQDGERYDIASRAFDFAANTQTALTTNIFRFDVSSPTALVQLPGNGVRYNTLPLVSGTAQDVLPGRFNVTFPQVRIHDIAINQYWVDGTGWVNSGFPGFPDLWNVALDSSSTGGVFTWRYDASAVVWPDRSAQLRVEARVADAAGNYSYASSTFSFDATRPASVVTYPTADGQTFSSMTSISGTSSDITSNVADVKVKMWYVTGPTTYYWSPAAPHWGAGNPNDFYSINSAGGPPAVNNPWAYDSVQNPDFANPGTLNYAWKEGTHDGANGKTFHVVTQAVDAAGNVQAALSTRTFRFDNVPPLSGPVVPIPDSSYNSLTVLSGTSVDAENTVAAVAVSIFEEETSRWFDGTGFAVGPQVWLPVLPANLFPSSWTFVNGSLAYTPSRHYVVRSSATDSVGNRQTASGFARFLFDTAEPTSSVVNPANLTTYDDTKIVIGNSSDPGFTSGINGTGSGVFPSLGWHQGAPEVMVFRDTAPLVTGGPVLFGGWDDTGYFWNGSTWVAAAPVVASPPWVPASFTDSFGGWQYSGLVCPAPNPLGLPCWTRGDPYMTWSRVRDNAGNLQTVVASGPRFFISGIAQSFSVVVSSDPSTVGNDIQITVTARDGPGGSGGVASSYSGSVNFAMIDGSGGPESMDTDFVADSLYGLPSTYPYTTGVGGDNGVKTFSIRMRKAGGRQLRVQQTDNPALFGTLNFTTHRGPASRVQLIADVDSTCTAGPGQRPGPGVVTPGSEGRLGTPRTFVAGQTVKYCARVTDDFYNLYVDSSATVYVSDGDSNNDAFAPGNDRFVVVPGSTTFDWTFVTASVGGQVVQSTGAGVFPNASNPASPVTVVGQPADRLVAVLPGETRVQGKFSVAPLGKSGVPTETFAGSTYTVRVYAVDSFYNDDVSVAFAVRADLFPDQHSSSYTQTLQLGTTDFAFHPVVAGTQSVQVQAAALPAVTSSYISPSAFTVWWSTPTKLQLLVEGQVAAPGLAPFNSNPTSGGRSVTAPATLTAGVTTTIRVNVTDSWYNVVQGTTPFIPLTGDIVMPLVKLDFLNDPNIQGRALAPNPYQRTLVAGTTTFSFPPVTRNAGLQLRAADTTATGTAYSTDTVSGITVQANTPIALLTLLPGESFEEGTVAGKTGALSTLTAGQSYNVTARAVDLYNNRAVDGRQVRLDVNDIYATVPAPQPLALGQAIFTGFLPSAATGNMTATIADDDVLFPVLSSQTVAGVSVIPNTPDRMIVALPGESLVPGKTIAPFGVGGVPSISTAGVFFTATAYATDSRYNVVAGVNKPVIVATSDDPFAPSVGSFAMVGGAASIANVLLRTAGTRVLTATDGGGGGPALTAGVSGGLTLNPNSTTRLRVLTPLETRVPGSTTNGRTGSAYSTLAGFSFNAVVDLTDAFWNLTPGASQEIRLVSDDPFAVIIPTTQVVTTSATYAVTLKRAGSTLLRAEMVNTVPVFGPVVSVDTATAVNVLPGVPSRLLTRLPGEAFSQGSPTGKSGVPSQQQAGASFSIQVGVVDAFFNLVTGRAADVKVLTPTDAYGLFVSTVGINTLAGITPPINVTLRRAATGHYLSADDFGSSGLSSDPQSSTFTVIPDLPMGLQLLLPGQTAVPGSGDYPNGGVTGTISTRTAGAPFTATINLVDRYMNPTSAAGFPFVYAATNDAFDVDPSTLPLAGGTVPLGLNLVTKTATALVTAAPRALPGDLVCTANAPTNICRAESPAAVAGPFKVFASTAVGLFVTVPGETFRPGKCDYLPGSVCRVLAPAEGSAGKDGTASAFTLTVPATSLNADVWLVDQFYNPVSDNAGPTQDTNPVAVMPTVALNFPADAAAAIPASQSLFQGNWTFGVTPLTSSTTWSVRVATTAASASTFNAASSALFPVHPGPAHHLHWLGLPATVAAGSSFSGALSAHDQYHNLLSTGPNAYIANVTFAAEIFGGNQDPEFTPTNNVTFSSSTDQGQRTLTSFGKLKRAGSRWLQAFETSSPGVNSEVAGFSVRPFITVTPGTPDSIRADATIINDINVSVGSLVPNNPGFTDIRGQLTDSFDNPITSTQTVYVEVTDIVGAPGHLEVDNGAGYVNVGLSTRIVSDLTGAVGVSTPTIRYYVSSVAGDSARVWIGTMTAPVDRTLFISAKKNITGSLTSVGGLPSSLVFLSTPTAALVGINDVPGAGGQYVVQRRDDFGNVTRQGPTTVLLDLVAGDKTVHASRGYTMGLFGTTGDYGFRDSGNSVFINSLSIADGQTGAEVPFRFHSRMTSYSGPGPSSNTAEGGRPGLWTVNLFLPGPTLALTHQLRMDPDAPKKVGFANPERTEVAGRVVDFGSTLARFTVQLQDLFSNPVVSTQNFVVTLATQTRVASRLNDYVGFSRSSEAIPGTRVSAPAFLTSTTTVDIPLGQYFATFYYLDTTASVNYDLSGGTKPILEIASPGLFSAQQGVYIAPDTIDRIAFSQGAGQTLLAGATSALMIAQTRDYYGNASPLLPGQDLGTGFVQLKLVTDSSGFVQFSTPATGAFVSSTAVAYLPVNRSTVTFYMIDTLLTAPGSTHTLAALGVTYPTWAVGYSSYAVIPGPPAQIGWATPPRRLTAGTTNQMELGVPTNTVVAAQLLDSYGNVTSSGSTYIIRYTSVRDTVYAGIDPFATIVATSPSAFWTNIFTSQLDVIVPGGAGVSQAPMYFWDTLAGGTTIMAQAYLSGLPVFASTSQVHRITPGPAFYLTVNHPYTTSNPLPVGVPGVLSIKARDLFGNPAAGDPDNGNYFTSVVNFASSGSTSTVTLIDLISGDTYHAFTPAEAGEFNNVGLVDQIVEVLNVRATDTTNASVYGHTNDGARSGLPSNPGVRSDGDVVLAGVVVTPADVAPESTPPPNGPIPPLKVALGVSKRTLNQGDGNTSASPDPIAMLRMNMRITPTGAPFNADLRSMRVQSRVAGNLDNTKITELALYRDDPSSPNGRFDPLSDVFLASGAYNGAGSWFFGSALFGQPFLDVAYPGGEVTLNSTQDKFYFFTVRVASSGFASGELPASFGLEMVGPSNITLAPGAPVGVAANNFAVRTATSSVEREPAQINVQAEDINAWWQPPLLTVSSYAYVNQGTPNVGVLKLKMWTDAFSGVISSVRFTHSGSGLDSAISRVRLYLDTDSSQTSTAGDGEFGFTIDKQVAEATFPPGDTRTANLVLTDPLSLDGTITTSTNTYYLVFDYDAGAAANQTHGMTLQSGNIVPLAGNGVVKPFGIIATTNVPVSATPDQVTLTDWNRQGLTSGTIPTDAIPSKLTQNDSRQPVAKMTLRVNSGAAEWTGLKLDRWLPSTKITGAGYNSLFAQNNKASDVTNLRVYLDTNNDGLLDVSTDSQVSPLNTVIHNFPTIPTAVALYATTPATGQSIPVTGILANIMFPTDNPFVGDTENRLVLGDDQTNELLKEVVYCHGLDLPGNRYTNCDRAQEGTTQLDFPAGTIVSGQARIPILSLVGGGGQVIQTAKLDYFVAYDVNPLASVSPQANLGLSIPSTAYYLISAPKTMSNSNVGVPPTGLTASFIPNLSEYPDKMRLTGQHALDGAIGPFLQQKSTVAVGVINVQTDVADALWRWLLVYATGTATQSGSVSGDVDLVQLWFDDNQDGLFNPLSDVLVGTGTFGNYQGLPLVSQINLYPPVEVVKASLAPKPQKYFITFVMGANAQPTDLLTQLPRTLGIDLRDTSLPTNSPVTDNIFLNSLSLPNTYDLTSPMPFAGQVRTIIAAPQVMSVRATPMFSTSSGTFPVPILDNPINTTPAAGTIEPFWTVSSTDGFPSPLPGATFYAYVGGEIIGYSGFGPGSPSLLNVERGALNTAPATHSSGTIVSPSIRQGEINLAAMRLELWSSQFQVQLSSINLNRILPLGLNGDDTDLTAVKVYRSLNGVFNRDPVSGLNAGDVLLGQSAFGEDGQPSGRVEIPINDPALGNPGYTLITATPTVMFVAFDVSPSAKFSHPALANLNEVTGAFAPDGTRFKLTPTNAGHNTVFVGTNSLASPTFVLAPTVNTVTAEFDQLSGNFALQNAKNVAMLRMRLRTNRNSALISNVRVDRVGSNGSLDSDIPVVKIWADANGNGSFDAIDSTSVAGAYPNLLSFGNETFSSSTVNIALRSPILVTTAAADYFVTYDISQFATENSRVGVAVLNPNYFTVQVPHAVTFSTPTFTSNPQLTISKVVSNVTLGVNDIATAIGGVTQAQANVAMLRFNMITDIALAPWRSLRVERVGGSQDPLKPFGRNTDVKFIRVFKDIDSSDALSASDVNISEVDTTLVAAISSTTAAPFDAVVLSTTGFPLDNTGGPLGGRLWVGGAELMTFSGPGCAAAAVPGVDDASGRPCLRITSRGDNLGTAATPVLNHSVGVNARKVDVFNQNNDADLQALVTLKTDQFIGPVAQSFFVAYDVGDSAVANDLIGIAVRDPSWIGLPRGDTGSPVLLTGITNSNPLGTLTTSYPFVGRNVPISPIVLALSGFSNAPSGAGQNDTNVPVLRVEMRSSTDFVNVSKLRVKQIGTIVTSTVALSGDGDVSRVRAWLDNGDGVFSAGLDSLLGSVAHSTSGAFSNGEALIDLVQNNVPYLRVSTANTVVFLTADVGFTDRAGGTTLTHNFGFRVEQFSDVIGPDGAPVTAAPHPTLLPPFESKTVLIAPLTIPGVVVSSALPPMIITRAQAGVPGEAVGYPAYALLSPSCVPAGKDPGNPRNQICFVNGNPVPDQSKWICANGLPWNPNCLGTSPLVDINGDQVPDNFSVGESTRPTQVSLLGDGTPTTDLTGTGILDVDINKDGILDMIVFSPGSNKPQFRIGLDIANQGNLAATAPDPGQGLAPSAWAKSASELTFNLPLTGTSGYYLVAVGTNYDDPIGLTNKWSSVTVTGVAGLSVNNFSVRAVGDPVTGATMKGLQMTVPNVTRLSQTLAQDTTAFYVMDSSKLELPGYIYVGSEIMRLQRNADDPNRLETVAQAGDPPPNNGRGLLGSAPILHTSGELVSDKAAILFAQYVSAGGALSPPQAMLVYRVDPFAPTTPGAATPTEQNRTSFQVRWTPSVQNVSGVSSYEIQERGGDPKDLASTVIWRTVNVMSARTPVYGVGDPTFPGEGPRAAGQFFSYRVRAISGAGVTSNWSPLTVSAVTGVNSTILSAVSNYPNPFDSRKGGNAGKTFVTYTLNADSDVTITIYDALGYLVKTISCPPGAEGGKTGSNFVPWDGRNDAGAFVSKGGYTARIRVKSPGGTATAIRKIGVIH